MRHFTFITASLAIVGACFGFGLIFVWPIVGLIGLLVCLFSFGAMVIGMIWDIEYGRNGVNRV